MNKLRNHKGMSLSEILIAVLIMALASVGMITGIVLANNQLTKQSRLSEANELFTTCSSLISNELRYANNISVSGTTVKFHSVTYANKDNLSSYLTLDEKGNVTNGYGYIALGSANDSNLIIGTAAYGTYDLGATTSVSFDESKKLFTVTLDIGVIGGESVLSRTFNVRAMNYKTTGGTS